jgi:hypothetical protein
MRHHQKEQESRMTDNCWKRWLEMAPFVAKGAESKSPEITMTPLHLAINTWQDVLSVQFPSKQQVEYRV